MIDPNDTTPIDPQGWSDTAEPAGDPEDAPENGWTDVEEQEPN